MKTIHFIFLVPLTLIAFILFFTETTEKADASAPSGLPATVYSREFISVGPQENIVLFDSSAGRCASRLITTYANPIMLNFSTSTNQATSTSLLSGTKGHLQAASTTQMYDSGLYGCDILAAYGYTASTTITVSEFR